MVRHVVCFKLKNPTESLLRDTKEILLSMRGRVPQLRDIEVGIDRLGSERSYDVILVATVDSFAALEDYQNDPYHCGTVKKHMHAVREASVAVDYEID